MIRAVARHISNRTFREESSTDMDAVRLKARSKAVTPRTPESVNSLGLPVSIHPSPATVASSTPQASQRLVLCGLEKVQCRQHTTAISGSTSSSSHSALRAPRVPVAKRATMFKPRVNASTTTRSDVRACTSSKAEKGSVHTTNSAKKLRLTNVDAGFGP